MGLLNWIFGKNKNSENHKKIKFNFIIIEKGEKIVPDKWFQKSSWNNKRFVGYNGTWSSDWKWSEEGKIKVVGISRDKRSENFIYLSQEDDFKMFLEYEPENPVNENARKIMASATINGEPQIHHIGYLPDEVATKYAGVELDIRPSKAFLPEDHNLNIGLEVALLVRSARYLKKINNY